MRFKQKLAVILVNRIITILFRKNLGNNMMSLRTLILKIDQRKIATLIINRPDVHNAMSIDMIREIRKVITGALELKRSEKLIGSSLEASLNIYLSPELYNEFKDFDFAEISITSSVNLTSKNNPQIGFFIEDIKNVSVEVSKCQGSKCQRCWKIYNEKNEICSRCENVVSK